MSFAGISLVNGANGCFGSRFSTQRSTRARACTSLVPRGKFPDLTRIMSAPSAGLTASPSRPVGRSAGRAGFATPGVGVVPPEAGILTGRSWTPGEAYQVTEDELARMSEPKHGRTLGSATFTFIDEVPGTATFLFEALPLLAKP